MESTVQIADKRVYIIFKILQSDKINLLQKLEIVSTTKSQEFITFALGMLEEWGKLSESEKLRYACEVNDWNLWEAIKQKINWKALTLEKLMTAVEKSNFNPEICKSVVFTEKLNFELLLGIANRTSDNTIWKKVIEKREWKELSQEKKLEIAFKADNDVVWEDVATSINWENYDKEKLEEIALNIIVENGYEGRIKNAKILKNIIETKKLGEDVVIKIVKVILKIPEINAGISGVLEAIGNII